MYTVNLMLSVKMLLVMKTYPVLFYTVGFVLLGVAGIASTLYLHQLAFLRAPFNKARQQMMQRGLGMAGFVIAMHLTLAFRFYSVMGDLEGEHGSEQNGGFLSDREGVIVAVGVSAGLASLFGFVLAGTYAFYMNTLQKQNEYIDRSKCRVHEMELYADAIQHLY